MNMEIQFVNWFDLLKGGSRILYVRRNFRFRFPRLKLFGTTLKLACNHFQTDSLDAFDIRRKTSL